MDRAEAIWYLQPIADSASLERYKEALNMAIAALREQEQKSPCSLCGYGGKHLDAPPCTKCPAHPKEQEPKVVEIDQFKNKWISVEEQLPEDLPENKGKRVIPCLVSLKSVYPNGKPNTQKRQRQLQYYGSSGWVWEWSRIGASRVTHWMPLPMPPKEEEK